MPVRRSKCISTKVTDEEYATIEASAGGQTLSAWAREVLLATVTPRLADQVLLAEFLALRTILLNLHFALATRGAPDADDVQALIERADQDKVRRAKERLWSASQRREP
jgi:hypothetical protein